MKNYQSSIEILNSRGYRILQIEIGENTLYFYLYKWEAAEDNSSSFHQAVGINITNFLDINHGNVVVEQFMSRFEEHIKRSELIRVDISKNSTWLKWSSYSETV